MREFGESQPEIRLSNSPSPDDDWETKHNPTGNVYLDVCPPMYSAFLRQARAAREAQQPEVVPLNGSVMPMLRLGKDATPKSLWLAASEHGVLPSEARFCLSD